MLNGFNFYLPGEVRTELDKEIKRWVESNNTSRIWKQDSSVWTSTDEEKWLGWLDMPERELADSAKYAEIARDYRASGFESVVLLGMGGSSLCPEVLAITFDKPGFHILDSTVPAQILALEERINLEKTMFIVASKSGSTLEPNSFKQYFYKRMTDVVGEDQVGNHFVAITDPGSKLEAAAKQEKFRAIYYGEPTVGGRFSALTAFGLVPAALMGLDVNDFLSRSVEMANACKAENAHENPGAALGLIMGVCHRAGRDKLTIFTSSEIYDLGAWMEQLVAESTGKNGVSIIPVDREAVQDAVDYGEDRIFTFITCSGDTGYDRLHDELVKAGKPVIRIVLDDIASLGQEFFRWEFATAVAGSVMGINPFDQPDVEAAKIEAKKITEAYEQTGKLPSEEPFYATGDLSFYGDSKLGESEYSELKDVLNKHLERITGNDYFALLAYVEMNAETEEVLQGIRKTVLSKYNVATCLGFGPRFLHSTGQAYKGGSPNGVFLQITSDDIQDLAVPGQNYTFGVIKSAQSRGDFQVLLDRGRRALRIHIHGDVTTGLTLVAEALQ